MIAKILMDILLALLVLCFLLMAFGLLLCVLALIDVLLDTDMKGYIARKIPTLKIGKKLFAVIDRYDQMTLEECMEGEKDGNH